MEGSRKALYLDFLTWVGGQRPWGPEESLMVGMGRLPIPPGDCGCKIPEDSHPWGFWLLHFNGSSSPVPPEAHGCALPQPLAQTLAMEVVKSWDTDGFLSKHYQAHVQGENPQETAGLPGVLDGLHGEDRY